MSGTAETERLAMQSLIKVRCCRVWEVTPLHPVGSCGIVARFLHQSGRASDERAR